LFFLFAEFVRRIGMGSAFSAVAAVVAAPSFKGADADVQDFTGALQSGSMVLRLFDKCDGLPAI